MRLPAALAAPLLLGVGVFLLRAGSASAPARNAEPAHEVVALPFAWSAVAPPAGAEWSLDVASSGARFEVGGAFGPAVATCAVSGSLRWGEGGRPMRIVLRLHTSRLRVESGEPQLPWELLGSRIHDDVVFEGACTESVGWTGRAAQRVTFAGGLSFGAQHWRQELVLWISSIRPGRAHLLGVGEVAGGLALPQRYVLGVLPASNRIALALDLACCSEDGKSR